MASLDSGLERSFLESLAPTLEADGYHVFIQPARSVLPPFMGNYRPDAVALKPGNNIAIEVMSIGRSGNEKVKKLQDLFRSQNDWQFTVYYAPPRNADFAIDIAHKGSIEETIGKIEKIGEAAGALPALLTAWAAFEAAGRALVPNRLARPQTPLRLLEVLASEGYVTPDEADILRKIVPLRNRAAHGDFDIPVTKEHLDQLIQTVRSLLQMWPENQRSD
jgi:uncharacterized protein YutE (UPF0331/DUF86 family)